MPLRENSCWPLIFNIIHDQNDQWVDTGQVPTASMSCCFGNWFLFVSLFNGIIALKRVDREQGSWKIFCRVQSMGKKRQRNYAVTVGFCPAPCWWAADVAIYETDPPPHVDGAPPAHTPEEPDREQNTQLTYPKLIHFLVSLLCMECWPEFYSPSCLVLPLWEKKDVFCDKKDSELSECHVFWCPEQCSFIAL